MSRLIAKILLAILLWPLAGMLYLLTCVVLLEAVDYSRYRDDVVFWTSGGVTWGFIIVYWTLLWRGSVRWESGRVAFTLVATAGCLIMAVIVAAILNAVERDFGTFFGSALGPLLWVVATVFLWRESPGERKARLGGRDTMVCPKCGYNLTGLSEARCPECGTRFTLDELASLQPSRATAEVEA